MIENNKEDLHEVVKKIENAYEEVYIKILELQNKYSRANNIKGAHLIIYSSALINMQLGNLLKNIDNRYSKEDSKNIHNSLLKVIKGIFNDKKWNL
jgi:hypothetical protein